jgi:hypothetical protein
MLPPNKGWGWQMTTPGKELISCSGWAITPSKVNPLVLNDTALWRTASFLLFANTILGELVEFSKEADSYQRSAFSDQETIRRGTRTGFSNACER